MFSLRREIADIDSKQACFRAALGCYLGSIVAMQEHAIDLTPELTREYQLALRTLHRAVFEDSSPDGLEKSRIDLASLMAGYRAKAESWKSEREEDLQSIIVTLAKAAETMTAHNNTHSLQLQKFTGELQKTARLTNISVMKRILEKQVEDLRGAANGMWRENNTSVAELEAKFNEFNERLARAEARASTDSLTGLLNRGEGEARLQQEINAEMQPGILLIDLNGFKQINDRWGHPCGDQVLKAFSRKLEQLVRPMDMLCRWGGDEFVVVLQSGDVVTSERIQFIRDRLRGRYKIAVMGGSIEIEMSASIGFAQAYQGESLDELIARADQEMYRHKAPAAAGLTRLG